MHNIYFSYLFQKLCHRLSNIADISFLVLYFSEKNYIQARYHYLHSADGKNLAAMLIEYHTTLGYPSEVDLFIAQTVLQ